MSFLFAIYIKNIWCDIYCMIIFKYEWKSEIQKPWVFDSFTRSENSFHFLTPLYYEPLVLSSAFRSKLKLISFSHSTGTMEISRTHIAFLAIISIFTGIIAPTIGSNEIQISYLMSNMAVIGFLILILLSVAFYSAGIRGWLYFRICMNFILWALWVLFILSIIGYISDIKTGWELSSIRWGWIFLLIGSALTLFVYKNNTPEEENTFFSTVDLFIGVIGGIWLLSLGILIFISSATHFFPSYKKQSILELDGIRKTQVLTGWLILWEPYTALSHVSFDRKKDTLTFVANSGGIDSFMILGKKISSKEEIAEWMEPLYIQNQLYKINSDGSVFSWNTFMKESQKIDWENALFTYNANTGNIFSEKASWSLSFTGKIENPLLSKNGTTLLWEEKKDGKINLWKQWTKIGTPYDKIIKTYVSTDGRDVISLVENNARMEVIKNGETVNVIPIEYLSWSFISNGSEYFYTIMKENIVSIVINGYQWEKKYEEVRDAFLEENGYSARGLMEFFDIIRVEEQKYGSNGSLYLRSHPLSEERISFVAADRKSVV